MSKSNLCRLCVKRCQYYERLYDSSGQPNEIYSISVKYFHPTLFNLHQKVGGGRHQQTVLCHECWNYILGFYNFQESVLLTQTKLFEDNEEMSSSSNKGLLDTNDDYNDHEQLNNTACIETVERKCTALPDIDLMDIYANIPSTGIHPLDTLDRKTDILSPSGSKYTEVYMKIEDNADSKYTGECIKIEDNADSKYTEECIKIEDSSSSENSADDCDELIGYFTDGNVKADYMAGSPSKLDVIKIESNTSEDVEMEFDDNEEFLSEDDINPNNNETLSEATSSCLVSFDGDASPKRKRKSLGELDDIIAEWKPRLECVVCHHLSPSYTKLQKHFADKHPKDKCHILCCNLKLNSRFLIQRHIPLHTTGTGSSSRPQNLGLRSTQLPLLDCLIKYYEPYLKCGICGEDQSNFSQLEAHFVDSHPQEQCHIVCCRRKLRTRHRIKEHISVHLDRTLFQCKVCQMHQVTRAGLQSHLLQRHGVDVKGSIAAISENTIAGRVVVKYLDDFIAQWRPELECSICSDLYPTFTLLQSHFQLKHPQEPESYIECCGQKLYQYHQIEEHIIFHQDPMAFKCQQCNEQFTSRPSLYSHSRLQHPLHNEDAAGEGGRTSKPLQRASLSAIDNSIAKFKPELPCYLCRETEPNFRMLQQHFRLKHPRDKFYIVCCERKLHSRCRYLSHQQICHTAGSKARVTSKQNDELIAQWRPSLTCSHCQEQYSTYTLLQEHFYAVHPTEAFYIKCCKSKMLRRCDFVRHIRSSHIPISSDNDEEQNNLQ